MAKWQMSDEEFERQYAAATRRGAETVKTEPQARVAFYDATRDQIIIELKNGLTLHVPCYLMQGLRDGDPRLIAKVKLLPRGAALSWDELQVDFSIAELLNGRFGNDKWMARLAAENEALVQAAKAKRLPARRPASGTQAERQAA